MTRDEWKAWFRELRETHEDWQVLDSVADMGEQVDDRAALLTGQYADRLLPQGVTLDDVRAILGSGHSAEEGPNAGWPNGIEGGYDDDLQCREDCPVCKVGHALGVESPWPRREGQPR